MNSNKCFVNFYFFAVIVNMSDKGISNLEITKKIENSSDDDLKANFVGAFALNEINYFISSHSLIKNKDVKYPL